MKKRLVCLSITLMLGCFSLPVGATDIVRLDKMTPEEKQVFEQLKENFSNTQLYSKARARLMYQSKLDNRERLSNNKEALKALNQNFHYKPEDMEKVAEKMGTTPLFQNPLNRDNEKEMMELIEKDTPTAMALIMMSDSLNPAFLPSDEAEQPLLSDTQPVSSSDEISSSKRGQVPSLVQPIAIPSVITLQPNVSEKKRLGRKSYRIHPNNLSYEKN